MNKKFNILLVSLFIITSCKNNTNNLIKINDSKEFLSINFSYKQNPGDDIMGYYGLIDGYINEYKENRFYNYLINFNNKVNKYYYVYLKEDIIKKYENEYNKYDINDIDGYFLNSYSNSKDYDINNLELYNSINFEFNKKINNKKLVACFASMNSTLNYNYSLKESLNKEYEIIYNVSLINKKIENIKNIYEGNYFVSGENDILNTNYLNSSFIGVTYSIYNFGNYINKIEEVDNKEVLSLKRYVYDLDGNKIDLLDDSFDFKNNYIKDYYKDYKKEFLNVYYKEDSVNKDYGYFLLDTLKEYFK